MTPTNQQQTERIAEKIVSHLAIRWIDPEVALMEVHDIAAIIQAELAAVPSEHPSLSEAEAEAKAREIVKRISDAAIELAFVRHSLTSDEIDIDDDASIKEQVAAAEAFCEGLKEDVLNCLTGDDTGCLDESELNETNCELLWLIAALHSASPQQPSGWQPIESAPKDGQAILLLSISYEMDAGPNGVQQIPAKVAIGHWWADGTSWGWASEGPHKEKEVYTLIKTGIWLSGGGWFQPDEVSHWMPLPAPPTENQDAEAAEVSN